MPEEAKTTTVSDALKELLNRKLRLWLYVLSALALMAFAALEAAEGDWVKAIPVFLTSLVPVLAAANINPPPEIQLIPGEVGEPGEKGDPGGMYLEGDFDPAKIAALLSVLDYDEDMGRYVPKHTGESTEDGEHNR